MPTRPPKPCCTPGCGAHALPNKARCTKHEQGRTQRYDRERADTDQKRFYGSAGWKRLREEAKDREPLCRMCTAEGVTRAAEEVDHINGDWRDSSPANLQPLCKSHHSQKTGRSRA